MFKFLEDKYFNFTGGKGLKIKLRTIIGKMNRLNLLHRLQINKAATPTGLYFGQLPILESVEENQNCTQKELSDILHVSPPSIATSVKRLHKIGILQKIADENDLRYTHITLTEKGQEISKECRHSFDKIDEQMFKGFSEIECEQLYKYIERLIENLSTDEEFKNEPFFSLVAKAENLRNKEENND